MSLALFFLGIVLGFSDIAFIASMNAGLLLLFDGNVIKFGGFTASNYCHRLCFSLPSSLLQGNLPRYHLIEPFPCTIFSKAQADSIIKNQFLFFFFDS